MTYLHHLLYFTAAGALFASGGIPTLTAPTVERVCVNDNTHAAGTTDHVAGGGPQPATGARKATTARRCASSPSASRARR